MTFFDPKRYDLARVGRYKFNKKLAIAARLVNQKPAEDVVDAYTGEVLAPAGHVISEELAEHIQNCGVNFVKLERDNRILFVRGNGFVNLDAFLEHYDPELYKQYQQEVADWTENGRTLPDLYERVFKDALVELADRAKRTASRSCASSTSTSTTSSPSIFCARTSSPP